MEDQDKTREQLISELANLRKEVVELKNSKQKFKGQLKDLNEIEERFRLMTENIHEVFWIAEPGKRIHYVSPAYEKIWGHPCESLYAQPKSFLDAIYPEDRGRVLAALGKQTNGEQTSEEYRIVRPDGSIRWIRDRWFPIKDNSGKLSYVTGIAEDITERKRTEEALTESEERFRALYEHIPSIYFTVDKNGTVISVNQFGAKQLGYSMEELVGEPIMKVFHKEAKPLVLNQLKACLRDPSEVHRRQFREVGKGGRILWVEEFACAVHNPDGQKNILIVCQDITERKEAEGRLQQSEEKFRTICENVPVMIDSFDQEGKCVLWNRECVRTLGWTQEEVDASDDRLALFYPDPEVRHQASKTIEKTDGTFREYCVSAKDGSPRIQLWANFLLPNGTVISVGHDITERKRLQKELSRAQRLETAGRVAGQIAHDFNNLLTPLAAYPILLRDYFPEDHSALKILTEMEFAAHKVAEINQQLLALGRRGHYRMELIHLNELIHETVLSQSMIRELTVHEKFTKDLFLIKGGAAQLSRILNNLITNAGEALQGSGTITLVTANIYLDKPLKGYKTVKVGEYVELEVADTGTGIEPEIIDKIFDPFFTTKRMDKTGGSGLGLSVVHSIVEDHNGYITVASSLGEGTTFSLYFPVARELEIVETVEKAKGGNEKILVIDDDAMQRKVATKLLKRLGYQVHSTASGKRAITYVKKHPQELLIVDMMMDGIDGTETYQRILEYQPDQRAIICSGFAKSQKVKKALRLGAGAFIPKPITLNTLASAVRKELDKK